MIFYFSATGNSEYAAKKTAAALGCGTVSIGEALRENSFSYSLKDSEPLGFALPTFAGTLPGAAARFIERLQLSGAPGYVFGILTCGGAAGEEAAALGAALRGKGFQLDAAFELVMPDNFILWSSLPDKARLEAILDSADRALDDIIAAVTRGEKNFSDAGGEPRSPYMPFQRLGAAADESVPAMPSLGEFIVTDACTGCGECARLCPMECIKMSGGKPIRDGECTLCLACLHRCPAGAVEYGDSTRGKTRYYNPRLAFITPS
ncbi:MAG: EFR1 family ferrodoxin [Oscillospiraceae bacterium]|jgi:ferredoxin/flavodoxin|nr:EFR1 family ferrodoxin [Oscillospiraceae bacterium]